MTTEELHAQIRKKRSFLSVGLDTDVARLPDYLQHHTSPVYEFNRRIIDATHPLAIAYKPNLAFYEARGGAGWEELGATVRYIRSVDPNLFIIADAKRGDIGNTAAMYARTFFDEMDFDAVTLSPYLGRDSIEPFLEYPGKWVILLGLTSNPGAEDFQLLAAGPSAKPLYETVIEKAAAWGSPDRIMFVAGATRPERIAAIRQIIPDHFLLVPGIGAQGGSLEAVVKAGMNGRGGLIINASRSILYADASEAFAREAKVSALALQQEMSAFLT